MLKRFDSKRVYNEKYLKTKINSYNGKKIQMMIAKVFLKNFDIAHAYQ